jgi:predicted dienelactone hydrolase
MGIPMRIIAALVLSFALMSEGQAQITIYKMANICGFDIQQYCKDIPLKKLKDMKQCLAKHEKDLLPRCQDHYKEALQ